MKRVYLSALSINFKKSTLNYTVSIKDWLLVFFLKERRVKINRYCEYLFLLFFLFVGFPAGETFAVDLKFLKDISTELNISLEVFEDYVIQKDIVRKGSENAFRSIEAHKDDRIIKFEIIENIDAVYAKKYADDKRLMVHSLFRRSPSAYPGMISKIIECPDRFKVDVVPIKIEGKDIPVSILYSTSRLTYGVCVEDLIKYQGTLTFIYSEAQKILYRIELFIPKNKFNRKEVLNSIASLRFTQQEKSVKEKFEESKQSKKTKQLQLRYDNGRLKDYNLIIIAFEPLGVNHVSAYEYSRKTTPNLDKFSKNAVLFKQAISPSSWTLPVFMSWFTSLYPSQHRLLNKYSTFTEEEQILSDLRELSPGVMTLAQVLKNHGYLTAGFTGGAGLGGEFGYDLGFDTYYDETKFGGFNLTMPKALGWLKEHRDEKFFLFIQGYDVHGRYEFPGEFKNKFVDPDYNGPYKGTSEEYWGLRNLSLDQKSLQLNADDVKFWRNWYDGRIYEADKRLGNFLKRVQKLDLMDKTVIVISSGSGNEFFEHKRIDHGFSLYEELIHVPFIIKIPENAGQIVEAQVRTIDIMPTVLELLDIEGDKILQDQMKGVSLVLLINGEGTALDAFSETDYLFHAFKRSIKTHDGWKYIHSLDTEQRELYNINDDPFELKNLVDKEQKIAYELEQRLFNWLKSVGQDSDSHKRIMEEVFKLEEKF